MPRPVPPSPEQRSLAARLAAAASADRLTTSQRRRGLADLVADAAHRQAADATAATRTSAL